VRILAPATTNTSCRQAEHRGLPVSVREESVDPCVDPRLSEAMRMGPTPRTRAGVTGSSTNGRGRTRTCDPGVVSRPRSFLTVSAACRNACSFRLSGEGDDGAVSASLCRVG